MAQTVLIKRSTTTNVPTTLENGELAYSSTSNKLFIGRPGGAAGDVDAIGGKYYTGIVDGLERTGSGSITGDVTGTLSYDIDNGTISGTTTIGSQTFTADTGTVQFHVPSSTLDISGDNQAIDTVISKVGDAVALSINHKDLLVTGTAGQSYGTATAIPVLKVNAEGHVTSISTTSISTTLNIKDDGNDASSVALATDTLKFAGGTYLTSDITATGTEEVITFSHDSTTRTNTTSTATATDGGTFTAVDSVTTNTEGHVTAVNVKTVTLPSESDTLATVTSRGNVTTAAIDVGSVKIGGVEVISSTKTITAGTASFSGDISANGNIKFPDLAGGKGSLSFGASDDLEIYHDGTHSYIQDNGEGNLIITSNGGGIAFNTNDNIPIAGFANDGSCSFNFNGVTKLQTTNTGATVTGTLVAGTFSGNLDWANVTNKPAIDNSIDYINSASFSTATGVLTLSGVGRAGATVDLDGRYLQSFTETDTLDSVTDRSNVTTNDISIGDLVLGYGVANASNEGQAKITGPGTITIDPSTTGAGGTVVIEGDLTVTGTTTSINSNVLEIGDNIVTLNSEFSRTAGDTGPTANAGLEINRGGEAAFADVELRWNETDDVWQVSVPVVNDQTTVAYSTILTQANYETQIPTIDGGTF